MKLKHAIIPLTVFAAMFAVGLALHRVLTARIADPWTIVCDHAGHYSFILADGDVWCLPFEDRDKAVSMMEYMKKQAAHPEEEVAQKLHDADIDRRFNIAQSAKWEACEDAPVKLASSTSVESTGSGKVVTSGVLTVNGSTFTSLTSPAYSFTNSNTIPDRIEDMQSNTFAAGVQIGFSIRSLGGNEDDVNFAIRAFRNSDSAALRKWLEDHRRK